MFFRPTWTPIPIVSSRFSLFGTRVFFFLDMYESVFSPPKSHFVVCCNLCQLPFQVFNQLTFCGSSIPFPSWSAPFLFFSPEIVLCVPWIPPTPPLRARDTKPYLGFRYQLTWGFFLPPPSRFLKHRRLVSFCMKLIPAFSLPGQ